MKNKRLVSALVSFSLLAVLCGCQKPSGNLQILNVGPVTPATRPLPAAAYGLLTPGTTRYINLENRSAAPLVITIAESTLFGGTISRTLNEQRVEYLGTCRQGNIVMYASSDVERQTTTLFPTPLIMASAALPPLQPSLQEVPATLVKTKDIDHVQAHGIGRRTAMYEGSCVLQTSKGPITTQKVYTDFKADLSVAQARYTGLIFTYDEPQPGIVALVLGEQLRVFGITIRSGRGIYLREDLLLPEVSSPSTPK